VLDPASVRSSADLCFLVDCTGSMQMWIDQVREKVLEIAADVKRTYPNVNLRMAFVGYRDFGDRVPLLVLPFTKELSELRDFVAPVRATGGGDIPEDVLVGMEAVAALDWRSRVRVMVHVTDAPTHGPEYHDADIGDSHPGPHPKGLTVQSMLERIGRNYIDYCFLEVPDAGGRILTRKMTAAFKTIYDQTGGHLCPMSIVSLTASGAEMFRGVVVQALLTSITTSQMHQRQ
jgi:hypothetical protein